MAKLTIESEPRYLLRLSEKEAALLNELIDSVPFPPLDSVYAYLRETIRELQVATEELSNTAHGYLNTGGYVSGIQMSWDHDWEE